MKFIRNHIVPAGIISIIFFLYRNWFSKGVLSATDFPFLYPMALGDFLWRPYAWSHILGNGLGGVTYAVLNLNMYLAAGVRSIVFLLHIPWNIAYRLLFYWPFLILGIVSSYIFCRSFLKDRVLASIGVIIYMSNTYVLMLSGGGQVGLMMAYALTPLVIITFIQRKPVWFTGAMAFLLLFDLRFSLLTAVYLASYVVMVTPNKEWMRYIRFSVIPAVIVAGLHSFWLVPFFFSHSSALPAGYDNPGWLSFLSWAEFSKTLSFLHPNWPENIFGKTYFMEPKFLVLPLVAFGSLLLLPNRKTDSIMRKSFLYFAALGILGAFLAKGVNPPFSGLYSWMFVHVPFFSGFRDPTKFYLYISLSYAILIPYSLGALINRLKVKKYYGIAVGVIFWLVLIWPSVTGGLSGTFHRTVVPSEYDELAGTIYASQKFSRTLAVPWRNRFVYQSEQHPIVDARDVFHTTDILEITHALEDPKAVETLKNLAVQYVIVPTDVTGEIFVPNRTYDASLRASVTHVLDTVPYLEKMKQYKDIDVYTFTDRSGLFYTTLQNGTREILVHHIINPTAYTIDITATYRPVSIAFSQSYDPNWKLWDGTKNISPVRTKDNLMEFPLDTNTTAQVTVYFSGEKTLDVGVYISLATLLFLLVIGLLLLRRRMNGPQRLLLFIVIAAVLGRVFWRSPIRTKDISADKHIWWSQEWMRLQDPVIPGIKEVSRYGGAEAQFRLHGSSTLAIVASSPNNEAGIQGIDVFVGGTSYTMVTPMHDTTLAVPAHVLDPQKTYDIRIRHWCAGSLSPCDAAISAITTDRTAIISPASHVPSKTLAILGDSIEVSFGHMNAVYAFADRLGYQLHNASIFGSSVSDVPDWDSALMRYQQDIVRYKPDLLVIALGTNDVGHGVPVDEFQKNYETLLLGIRAGSPRTKIIAVGLLYRNDWIPVYKIQTFNAAIRTLAAKYQIPYVDSFDWFTAEDLMDGLHPKLNVQGKFSDDLFQAVSPLL